MESPIREDMSERGPKVQPHPPTVLAIDTYGCEPAEARLDGEPPVPEASEHLPASTRKDTVRLKPIRPRA